MEQQKEGGQGKGMQGGQGKDCGTTKTAPWHGSVGCWGRAWGTVACQV